jgi:hypothetical protein
MNRENLGYASRDARCNTARQCCRTLDNPLSELGRTENKTLRWLQGYVKLSIYNQPLTS